MNSGAGSLVRILSTSLRARRQAAQCASCRLFSGRIQSFTSSPGMFDPHVLVHSTNWGQRWTEWICLVAPLPASKQSKMLMDQEKIEIGCRSQIAFRFVPNDRNLDTWYQSNSPICLSEKWSNINMLDGFVLVTAQTWRCFWTSERKMPTQPNPTGGSCQRVTVPPFQRIVIRTHGVWVWLKVSQ